MKVGSVIKEIRSKRGISQGKFAQMLSISQTYLSQIERDRKSASMDLLVRIGENLNIPVYYLMFKGLEVDKDISIDKREAYKKLSPAIGSMIETFFVND